MWATTLFHHPLPALQWGVALGAALVAACTDVRARRIPNLLTGPVLVVGLGVAASVGGWAGLADALAAALVTSLPFLFLFAFAAGGAGDAKLMGALGAWLGLVWGTAALALVCLSGVLLGALRASFAGRLEAVLRNLSGVARGFLAALLRVPRAEGVETGGGRLDGIRASLLPTGATSGAEAPLTVPYALAILSGVAATAVVALIRGA